MKGYKKIVKVILKEGLKKIKEGNRIIESNNYKDSGDYLILDKTKIISMNTGIIYEINKNDAKIVGYYPIKDNKEYKELLYNTYDCVSPGMFIHKINNNYYFEV